MNERIKELREQAWAIVGDEQRAKGELYEVQEQWERCDQVFAELIVLECADVFKQKWTMAGSAPTISAVKEHFGVKK